MMEPNKIILTKNDFGDNLYEVAKNQVLTLVEAGNSVVSYKPSNANGVVVIEFFHNDDYSPRPFWLTPDDLEILNNSAQGVEEKKFDA